MLWLAMRSVPTCWLTILFSFALLKPMSERACACTLQIGESHSRARLEK